MYSINAGSKIFAFEASGQLQLLRVKLKKIDKGMEQTEQLEIKFTFKI